MFTGHPITMRERAALALFLCAMTVVALMCANCCDARVVPDHPAAVEIPPDRPAFHEQRDIVEKMGLEYGIEIGVTWKYCNGELNAYYLPLVNIASMCAEVADHPQVGAFFAAHEAGHAITAHYARTVDEENADEIATLALLKMGREDAVRATANYWRERPDGTLDGHPINAYRAWEIDCLADGYHGRGTECVELFHATHLRWQHRLGR